MNRYVDEVERAFQLAQSGEYGTIGEIKKRLMAEGYWDDRIAGPLLLRQLRDLIKDTARQRVAAENPASPSG